MNGKTVQGTFDFNGDYRLIKFTDGSVALVKVVNAELAEDEVKDLVELLGGEAKTEKKKEPVKKAEKGKPAKKGKKKEPEKPSWEDIEDMDHEALVELCEEHEIDEDDVDPEDYDEDEEDEMVEFRKEVAEALGIEVTESDEGESKDDDYTWDDLAKLDFEELEELVEEEELEDDVDMEDYDEDEDGDEEKLRKAIAEVMNIPVPTGKKKKKKK